MSTSNINHIQRDPVMVDFSITDADGFEFDSYVLYEQKNAYSYPTNTFTGSTSGVAVITGMFASTTGTNEAFINGTPSNALYIGAKYSIYSDEIPQEDEITFIYWGTSAITLSSSVEASGSSLATITPVNFDPCFVPLNQTIRFTPIFKYSTDTNDIIQYKWNFGDGRQSLVLSPIDPITYTLHKYSFGLDTQLSNGAYNSTSMITSLTVIDKYYRHTRHSKIIYPRVYS
jgi:hypothetical protein